MLSMADFTFVTSRLATGAQIEDEADVAALVSAGITHIIDCQIERDDSPLLLGGHPAITYKWNGVGDDGNPATHGNDWFGTSLTFALPAIAQTKTKIYAHCAAGRNRGPSTAYAIMLALGWDAATAETMIRAVRPQVTLAYKSEAQVSVHSLGYV